MRPKYNQSFRTFSVSLIAVWLIALALMPFLLVFLGSFLHPGEEGFFKLPFTLQNYKTLLDLIYLKIFTRSFYLAGVTTFFCLLVGYPCAYIMARLDEKWKAIFLVLLIIPFWTSSLVRVYAIIILIRAHGLVNNLLIGLGFIHTPIQMLYTQTAVVIGSVYSLLPFMILPLYANLEKFNWKLIEAAKDLGAKHWQYFWKIVIPLTVPGIVSGIILVFLPTMSLFFIPDILGGARSLLLGNVIKNQFIEGHHWPMGSSLSVVLTIVLGLMLLIYSKTSNHDSEQDLL